jgi:hypothetical protein
MRFLIDERLHESLVVVAHSAGLEATHINHLGLSGKPDWELAVRIVEDEFTFVTQQSRRLSSAVRQDRTAWVSPRRRARQSQGKRIETLRHNPRPNPVDLKGMVGATGLEPVTSCV